MFRTNLGVTTYNSVEKRNGCIDISPFLHHQKEAARKKQVIHVETMYCCCRSHEYRTAKREPTRRRGRILLRWPPVQHAHVRRLHKARSPSAAHARGTPAPLVMMARASPSFSELGQGRPHSAAALEQPAAASPSPSKAYALATWMEPERFIQWYADVLRINGGSRFLQQERRVAWRRTRQQRWRCGGAWGGPWPAHQRVAGR